MEELDLVGEALFCRVEDAGALRGDSRRRQELVARRPSSRRTSGPLPSIGAL